jgi:quinol monooxygenase YgiN
VVGVSEPLVFISHFGVNEGTLDDLRRLSEEIIEGLRQEKPRTVLYLAYLDEEGTEVSFLHAFPDADSMDLHLEGANERVKAAYQYLAPRGWEIYGRPSDAALESMQQAAAGTGVPLTVLPDHLGGFLRLRSA